MLLALLAIGTPVRDTVTFDFGWKHRTGLHTWAKPTDRPPINTAPGLNPAEAQAAYDDSDWKNVSLPHDGLAGATPSIVACPDGCSGKSFIPRHVLWYRKQFMIPAEWTADGVTPTVWLDFDGSFRNTTVWLNGQRVINHECGYTPFRVHLGIHPHGIVSASAVNTIVVYVDPDNGDAGGRDHGSGWWYEGGGLYRHVRLVRVNPTSTSAAPTHVPTHFQMNGLFAYSNVSLAAASLSSAPPASAVLHVSASVVGDAPPAGSLSCVAFTVSAPDGSALAGPTIAAVRAQKAVSALKLPSVSLWTPKTPALYTVHATLSTVTGSACAAGGRPEDELYAPHGFRTLAYDADHGFALNGEHFKVRGFCDHNSFAVVGMAVPERISLFRAQASRAVGGNGRRTSHNPPDPSVLDIYDRIGIVVMDENRLFANKTAYVENMGVMVQRDRNHPSVVIWSFCNEAGCEGSHEAGGPRFREIAYEHDGSRPTLANMFTFGDLLSNTIDVQGFSHQTRAKLDTCHAKLPHKPIYSSECCSCNTMRAEDEGCETLHDNPHNICTQKSFNARCTESNAATNASDGVDYAIGTMVWTLFDYYGEPPVGGPEVSSTYGQYDLCGFPKAAAFWYRMQWLLGVPDSRSDKTFLTGGKVEVYLVESWESPDAFPSTKGNTTRAIHAYTSAPLVELLVNGKSIGSRAVVTMHSGPGSYAEWLSVPWEAGNLTAVARKTPGGAALASTSRFTNGAAATLKLSLDAPSAATGTGDGLVLDGQDAALLRASVLDAHGRVMHLASDEITFSVLSGPGEIQGTHNGDPHNHVPSSSTSNAAYHGLVRAVVRVTSVAARHDRALAAKVDVSGPLSATALGNHPAVTGPIVVQATSPGFAPVTISISTTGTGVMAAATNAAGMSVDFFDGSAS